MPLEPKILNYENAQFLLIGNAETDSLEKATIPQPEDKKQNKDSPMEEIEKLEHEDELRVQHLKGNDLFLVYSHCIPVLLEFPFTTCQHP